jgi:hypothetical protein
MFEKGFDSFSCEGDSIECIVDGFTIKAFIERDDNGDAPDERDCGFWPSLNPNDAGYIGANPSISLEAQKAKAECIMQAWKDDKWFYCGVCVVVSRCGVELYANAVWGIECNYPDSDNSYLTQTANELLAEALEQARNKIEELAECSTLALRSKVQDAYNSMNA